MHAVLAHVKWFSEYDFHDKPAGLAEVLTPSFWAMAGLSLGVIALLVLIEKPISQSVWAGRLDSWFSQFRHTATTIMRVGVFATLLWAWQMGVLFAPDLTVWAPWVGWAQFVVALLMLLPVTVPLGGAALIGLYAAGVGNFGFFHMLDYLLFIGVGYYLIVTRLNSAKLRESGLPVMYATVGFCLAWLAAEKLVYPQWSLYLLAGHPELTFGIDHRFFLVASAFIELSLGYLLIICLFERTWAIIITCTFFSTSMVFGKTEVIGHTILHAALLVFLVQGAGERYTAPIRLVRQTPARLAVALVGFAALLAVILIPYSAAAKHNHRAATADSTGKHTAVAVDDWERQPALELSVSATDSGGWNLHIRTEHFRFAPEHADGQHVRGEGHAHLYVDGRKAGRIYGNWHYIPPLPAGTHELRVTLNANHHGPYTAQGVPISAELTVEQER